MKKVKVLLVQYKNSNESLYVFITEYKGKLKLSEVTVGVEVFVTSRFH